jgi:hypothetical protein
MSVIKIEREIKSVFTLNSFIIEVKEEEVRKGYTTGCGERALSSSIVVLITKKIYKINLENENKVKVGKRRK